MRQTIKRIIKEVTDEKKDKVFNLAKTQGWARTFELVGGLNNFLDMFYDGDVIKFSEDTHTPLAYISVDEMRFYIHEALVEKLGLKDVKTFYNRREKELGDFRFGAKNGIQYKFTATLIPTTLNDQPYYKVAGYSGDSGFGYSFINKRNTLGKRYRKQIFKQIIDKYSLEPYMKLKTFY